MLCSLLLLMLLFSTACSPVTLPPKHYYNLEANLGQAKQNTASQLVILVTPTGAEAPYRSNKMAYSKSESPYQISYFAENYWASPPARLISPNVTRAMNASGYFKAVANPPYGGMATYRLDTDLLTLRQQFNGNTSSVTLSLQAVLVNAESNQVLRSRLFTVTQAAVANNPEAGAIAANQALSNVMQQLQSWVIGK